LGRKFSYFSHTSSHSITQNLGGGFLQIPNPGFKVLWQIASFDKFFQQIEPRENLTKSKPHHRYRSVTKETKPKD
jgi:hypothetical protein